MTDKAIIYVESWAWAIRNLNFKPRKRHLSQKPPDLCTELGRFHFDEPIQLQLLQLMNVILLIFKLK